MKGGGGLIAAAVIGGLMIVAGLWMLVTGLSCSQAESLLPGSSATGTLSGICSTYEVAGAVTLIIAIILIVGMALSSRHGHSSGRRIGR